METDTFQIEILNVVHNGVTDYERVRILQQTVDFFRKAGKYGVVFELLVFIRQDKPLRTLAVGKVEIPLWIDENIFLLQDMELFVGKAVPERANFSDVLEHPRTFDIEK